MSAGMPSFLFRSRPNDARQSIPSNPPRQERIYVPEGGVLDVRIWLRVLKGSARCLVMETKQSAELSNSDPSRSVFV